MHQSKVLIFESREEINLFDRSKYWEAGVILICNGSSTEVVKNRFGSVGKVLVRSEEKVLSGT